MKMSDRSLNEQHVRNRREELPTLGIAVNKVINMASTGEKSVNQLAQFVLSDVGLTQNILRLANSVSYRSAQTTPITTISKAIFILGFDTVKTSALAMLMLERFTEQGQVLHTELTHALCASIVARECVNRSIYQDAEEATVAALFKNIGRVLLAVHAPDIYKLILQSAQINHSTINQAAFLQLGCGLEHFGTSILQSWGMPDTIVQSIAILPPGVLKKAMHRGDWQKQVASFSYEVAEIILQDPQIIKEFASLNHVDFSDNPVIAGLVLRYGTALDFTTELVVEWINKAAAETRQLAFNLGMKIDTGTTPETVDASIPQGILPSIPLPDHVLMTCGVENMLDIPPDYLSGKPANACPLLLAGVMSLTQTIVSGNFVLNQLFVQLLDILHKSMGFRFTTACLKEVKGDRYMARISIGENWQTRQRNFNFEVNDANDLFHLAIKNNADVIVTDVTDAAIAQLLPDWYRQYFPEVQSMLILPLVVQGKAIGLLYADRIFAAPEGIFPDEVVLIKAMKAQLIAAMGKFSAQPIN